MSKIFGPTRVIYDDRKNPKQQEATRLALGGEHPYLLFGGGIKGGKTSWGVSMLFLLCRMFPGSRWAVVRKHLPELRRNFLPVFEKFRPVPFCGPMRQDTWTARCENGSEIILFPESLDVDPDLDRFKGLDVNGFLLEEAPELAYRTFVKCQERAGSWRLPSGGSQPPRLVMLTCNPAPGWVKRTFYDPWKAGDLKAPYAFVPALAADNAYNPEEFIAGLEDQPEAEYKRFVLGEWDHLSGQFFDMLRSDLHFVKKPASYPTWWQYWAGYDWGYRHNAAAVAFAKDGEGCVTVLDTLYVRRMSDVEQAQVVRDTLPLPCLDRIYAGPDCFSYQQAHSSRTHSVADVFAEHQMALIRANDKRVQGWAALARGLHVKKTKDRAGKVVTHPPLVRFADTPGNRRLFDDLSALVANPTNDKDALKVDADDNGLGGDDGPDALRYGMVSALPHWGDARQPVMEALPSPDTTPGWDYKAGTRKPNAQEVLMNEWRKELMAGKGRGPRMPRVGRTPGLS